MNSKKLIVYDDFTDHYSPSLPKEFPKNRIPRITLNPACK